MVAMLSMIFGQKLDRVWRLRFDNAPELVNPILSIGATAAAYAGSEDRREMTSGQWELI
jgi:hypothetical protein